MVLIGFTIKDLTLQHIKNNTILIMSIKKFNTPDFYNTRLYETKHFAVIPSLGSIVEGWLLIIPKKHYLSLGYLQSPELYSELESLLEYIGYITKKLYGEYILFENGAFCSDKLVGCGVDYAHIHIVPTHENLIEIIENDFHIKYNWKKIDSILESQNFVMNNKPYLYYRNQQGISYITTDNNIPSQLFRKAIAYKNGYTDKYDWKTEIFKNNILRTITKYQKAMNYGQP